MTEDSDWMVQMRKKWRRKYRQTPKGRNTILNEFETDLRRRRRKRLRSFPEVKRN